MRRPQGPGRYRWWGPAVFALLVGAARARAAAPDEDRAVLDCPPGPARGSVLLVHGSAPFNADGVVPIAGLDSPYARDPFYRDLARELVAAGWCALRYDKPGVQAEHVAPEVYAGTDLATLSAQLDRLWRRLPADRPRAVFAWSEGSLHVRALPLAELNAVVLLGALATHIADAVAAQGGPGRDELLQALAGRDRRELLGPDRPVGRLLDELALDDNWRTFEARPDLPILVLHGEADAEVPVSQAEVWRARLPGHGGLTVVTRPAADHRLMAPGVYDPGAVARVLIPWLDRAVAVAARYRPGALPPGVVPRAIFEREGHRWVCEEPGFDPSRCSRDDALLARWEGRIGERGLWVRVDVSRLDPVEAATDRAWSRRLWAETHGSSQVREARLRFWRDGEARRAESAVQWGGGEVDPAWSLVRFQEQPDGVLYLRLVVGGVPSAADRARLRAAFVDGPLGAPPGFGP